MTMELVPVTEERPGLILARATEQAELLAKVVEKQRLFVDIGSGRHVRIEGWTFLGSMRGVFPIVVWTHPIEDGWEARVEARTINGNVVGAAEAQCTRKEDNWLFRDDYALRSMAQTRAASKALRLPLGYIMVLAGFEATPAEEMPSEAKQTKDREHWCEEHQVNWFKRGKMKGYAHPVADTGEWCNEPEPKTSPLVQEAIAQGATVEEFCPHHPDTALTWYEPKGKAPFWGHNPKPGASPCRFSPMELAQARAQSGQEEGAPVQEEADLDPRD